LLVIVKRQYEHLISVSAFDTLREFTTSSYMVAVLLTHHLHQGHNGPRCLVQTLHIYSRWLVDLRRPTMHAGVYTPPQKCNRSFHLFTINLQRDCVNFDLVQRVDELLESIFHKCENRRHTPPTHPIIRVYNKYGSCVIPTTAGALRAACMTS